MSDLERIAMQLKPFTARCISEATSFAAAARVLAAWVFTQPTTFADDVKIAQGLNLGASSGAGAGCARYTGDLQAGRNATYYTGYVFVPLTTSLTSTDWDGDAKSASGTIDLQTVFGVPAGVKAVAARLMAKDETVGVQFALGPSASHATAIAQFTQAANVYACIAGIVPCDANGDVYFYTSGELDGVYLAIYGYFL